MNKSATVFIVLAIVMSAVVAVLWGAAPDASELYQGRVANLTGDFTGLTKLVVRAAVYGVLPVGVGTLIAACGVLFVEQSGLWNGGRP